MHVVERWLGPRVVPNAHARTVGDMSGSLWAGSICLTEWFMHVVQKDGIGLPEHNHATTGMGVASALTPVVTS